MNCPSCQAPLQCDSQQANCWCFSLPNILPLTSNTQCLCKPCLIDKINEDLARRYKTQSHAELLLLAAQYQNQFPLEKLDYYINEDGYRVMTKWAHLKRGYCCGNGCKHCAY